MACMKAPIDCHYPFTNNYHKKEAVISGSEHSLYGVGGHCINYNVYENKCMQYKMVHIFPLGILHMKKIMNIFQIIFYIPTEIFMVLVGYKIKVVQKGIASLSVKSHVYV